MGRGSVGLLCDVEVFAWQFHRVRIGLEGTKDDLVRRVVSVVGLVLGVGGTFPAGKHSEQRLKAVDERIQRFTGRHQDGAGFQSAHFFHHGPRAVGVVVGPHSDEQIW
jgi:hypothetical protein